jgi:UDP-hydrolysing UDP-N-acetyl-D-glucosamine 2-epimerase
MTVSVVITARPSYARVKTAIQALHTRDVDVNIVCAASTLLDRYGRVADVIKKDFRCEVTELWSTYEGATRETSAKETGTLLSECASHFARVKPDAAVVIADRHEVLAPAMAAAYQHIPLVHLQGGEHSGSIDNRVRHAITQLADAHCVATLDAQDYVKRILPGATVWLTGCPSIDLAGGIDQDDCVTLEELGGRGDPMDLSQPFLVVLQHTDTRVESNAFDMLSTLTACEASGYPTICFWPGEDADADSVSKQMRTFNPAIPFRTVRNLPPERFLKLLTQASCLVGNSSVGIRECAFLGVPVVNIGLRQERRERASNVLDIPTFDVRAIQFAIAQHATRTFASSPLYGLPGSGDLVAHAITQTVLTHRAAKQRTYVA